MKISKQSGRLLPRNQKEATREQAQSRDLEILNQAADRLNAEAADALDYQASEE